MSQLTGDFGSGDLAHLAVMVLREEELPSSLDNQLEECSGEWPETLADWLLSMRLGDSCSDLVRSNKAPAQVREDTKRT